MVGSGALVATLALGGLCAVMWWLARLAKRRMGVGAGTISAASLRIVGKRPLDQKSSLYVVEIAGGRHILIGAGADGTVTKVDDISTEEFSSMVEEPAAKAPKLRVARSSDDATGDDDTDADDDPGETPKFATVGESFGHLLRAAKRRNTPDARTRRHRPASGE